MICKGLWWYTCGVCACMCVYVCVCVHAVVRPRVICTCDGDLVMGGVV